MSRASELVHLTLAPHVMCAAHGEWMDARAASEQDAAVTPDTHDHSRVGLDSGGPALTAEHHEHCALAAHRLIATTELGTGPVLWSQASAGELAGAPRPAVSGSRKALLLKAPKNSPPA